MYHCIFGSSNVYYVKHANSAYSRLQYNIWRTADYRQMYWFFTSRKKSHANCAAWLLQLVMAGIANQSTRTVDRKTGLAILPILGLERRLEICWWRATTGVGRALGERDGDILDDIASLLSDTEGPGMRNVNAYNMKFLFFEGEIVQESHSLRRFSSIPPWRKEHFLARK